jgi:hypothetical protein
VLINLSIYLYSTYPAKAVGNEGDSAALRKNSGDSTTIDLANRPLVKSMSVDSAKWV